MANKTANFNLRMEPQIKTEAEELFGVLGLTLADAVNIFIYKSLQVQGIPFDVNLASEAVVKAHRSSTKELPKEEKEPVEIQSRPVVEEKREVKQSVAPIEKKEEVKTPHRSSVQDLFRNM